MLLHPSFMFFIFFLFLSIFILISSPSWFMCWLALEINMLSFIPLILKKKNKYTAESALKYFLVQAIASMLIIIAFTMMNNMKNYLLVMIITSSLLLKIGCAPFHQWAPSLVEGFTWPTTTMFLILQKINPLILISVNSMSTNMNNKVILLAILMSSVFGCIGGLNQTHLRKLMVYSSIAHLAWLISTIYISSPLWMSYYLVYSLIIFCVTNIMNNMESYTLNHLMLKNKKNSFMIMICFFSLGGIPPFSGFLPKFMTTLELINNSLIFMLLFLLTSAFISLFFYTRLILTSVLLSKSYKMNSFVTKNKKEYSNMLNIIFMLTPMTIFIM